MRALSKCDWLSIGGLICLDKQCELRMERDDRNEFQRVIFPT